MNQYPEADRFQKIESLLLSKGLKFTPQMQLQYFNDPMFKALFTLILELFERDHEIRDNLSNWDPWDDF